MTPRKIFIAAFILFLLSINLSFSAEVSLDERIKQINQAIGAANAEWRAGHSMIAEMPMDDFTSMLGARIGPVPQNVPHWMPNMSMDLPTHYDWRNIDGKNFLTPVKYQGRCGSCVAFGCIGGIEAGIKIREQNPDLDVDLSEQHAFACTTFSGCDYGSTAWDLLSTVKYQGVVDENCFPYLSGGTGLDYSCQDACDDASTRLFKIAGFSSVWGGVQAIKQALVQSGPLPATMNVFEDFKYYIDGVYQHVFGQLLGGHQVVIVGWDDPGQYWIAKNSWSEKFGEDGYFRIKWFTCGISSGVTKINIGSWPFTPGDVPGGDCSAAANHIYSTCQLTYELEGQPLSSDEFLTYCNSGNIPQCVHACNDEHSECNRLAGCIGFCTDQWCSMDFQYLYDTCGLDIELEAGNPLSKEDAISLCEQSGYASAAMKCILECIPRTDTCNQLDSCMQECPLCPFPTVDFTADVATSDAPPLTVTFTRNVIIPPNCDPTVSHWDFGDGTTTYDPSDVIVHTYNAEGIFSVELRVTNAAGPGVKYAENLIHIGPPPPDDDTADDDSGADDDSAVDDDTVLDDDSSADDDASSDDDASADDDAGADDDAEADDDAADDDSGDDDSGTTPGITDESSSESCGC